MDRLWVSVVEPSLTCAVKLEVPAEDGVPEITPVEELRLRPAGREPEEIDQE